jgi:hypothetical protein
LDLALAPHHLPGLRSRKHAQEILMPKPAKRTKNKLHVKRIKRKKKMLKAKSKSRKKK